MATQRPLNHSQTSINTPSIELERPRQKRNTYLDKKLLHDSEATHQSGVSDPPVEQENELIPTFMNLMAQVQRRGDLVPASHPSGTYRQTAKVPRKDINQGGHPPLRRQRTVREPTNLRDDYFQTCEEPGFGKYLVPKKKETQTKHPSMGPGDTSQVCYRIMMDAKAFYRIKFQNMINLLDQYQEVLQGEKTTNSILIMEVQNLSPEQIHELFNHLDLEPVVASECSLFHSIDKMDIFDTSTFIIHTTVVVRSDHAQEEDDRDLNYFEPIRIFRHQNLLIFFSKKDFSLVQILQNSLSYIEHEPVQHLSLLMSETIGHSLPKMSQEQSSAMGRQSTIFNLTKIRPNPEGHFSEHFQTIIFVCLFHVIKLLQPFIELMLRQVNRVQRLASSLSFNEKMDYVQSLGNSQTLLSHLMETLKKKKDLIQKLIITSSKDQYDKIKKITAELFSLEFAHLMRHIYDRILLQQSILKKIKFQLEITTDTFQAHADQTLNEFTNRLNNSMNLFAAIATIFLPLGLIAGIFGMNVHVPWQERTDEIWPFWVIISIMVVIFIILFAWVKCRKLI